MEFSWVKNSFCVLLVLRLAILLGDSPAALLEKLAEAKAFLRDLANVGMEANISYMRILAQTIDKCERAVHASLQARAAGGPGDTDFHSFLPQEFLEWDFPGLNLCYNPLDWQDLFLDFSGTI
ncbi:hypothetical protein Slin15195_G007060 [Septoria linicola]|uniref:Uncharacterized protein n=1 Tax=Septoria linicola TaxID=215465 RepID=A0A9Q9EF87_9PEZI|nr:hypothetical protein Slin14017_G007070 [Septoria linicola]USW47387.1 hypothetical protein Slin15195_G007060 [Septoria linicola]